MSLATGSYALLVTKLIELTGITAANIVRVTTLNTLGIEERFRQGNLATPFLVLLMGQDQDADWGMGNRVTITPIDIGYVTLQSTTDTLDVLETACEGLVTGLYGFQQQSVGDSIQILDMPIKDVDMANEFNQVCVAVQNGFIAGSVRIKVVHGDIP